MHETLSRRVIFTLIQDRNVCGLRTGTLLDEHVELGQVGGSIVLVSDEERCDRWIRTHDFGVCARYIKVQHGLFHLEEEFAVVDVSETPFRAMRQSVREANLHVEPDGRVVVARSVHPGEELIWRHATARECQICRNYISTTTAPTMLRRYASRCPVAHVCDACYRSYNDEVDATWRRMLRRHGMNQWDLREWGAGVRIGSVRPKGCPICTR